VICRLPLNEPATVPSGRLQPGVPNRASSSTPVSNGECVDHRAARSFIEYDAKEHNMFARFSTAEEVFAFQLGSALSMERRLVEFLEQLEEHAQREEIRHPLAVHRQETLQHIANIEQCFMLLGEAVHNEPWGVVEAIASEGKSILKKTDDSLADVVIASLASEAEHYEIAVYETLIASADTRGADAVAKILRQNLAQEKHALTVAHTMMKTSLQQGIAVAASA
jgi:ferritin-like metal-binding protein YciE